MQNLPVLWVNAAAHAPLPKGGNHWCLYLRVPNDHSVRIDIIPSYSVPSVTKPGGSKANMVVSYLRYGLSRSAMKAARLDIRPGTTVRDFIDLLVSQKRHQYEFNSEGQGCRYWTNDQINFFWDSGFLVNKSQVTEAKNAIHTEYPSGKPYEFVVGAYYWWQPIALKSCCNPRTFKNCMCHCLVCWCWSDWLVYSLRYLFIELWELFGYGAWEVLNLCGVNDSFWNFLPSWSLAVLS